MKIATKHNLILVIFLILTACSGGGGGGNNGTNSVPDITIDPNDDSDGDGVINSDDVDYDNDGLIEIASIEQLDWMRNDLAGTSLTDHMMHANSTGCPGSGCNGYELVSNLNFDTNGDGMMDANDNYYDYDGDGSNAGWLPIGDITTPFTGNFNGNGISIRNLYINRPFTDQVGLFGVIDGTTSALTIQNLVIEGPLTQITGRWYGGGLAGSINSATAANIHSSGTFTFVQSAGTIAGGVSASTINNCTGSGSVSADFFTGGLFSHAGGSTTINNSHTDADVTNALSTTGGLLAILDHSSINNSSASGNVTGGVNLTGGLVGRITGSGSLISHSYATGQVTGGNESTGGLVGGAPRMSMTIANSYATGDVTGEDYTGGLLGSVIELSATSVNLEIHNSYATGNVTGNNSVGGLVGQSTGLIVTKSFSTGDVMGNVNYVGGLMGLTYNTTITDTFATGNVNAIGRYAGGLIGDANASTAMTNNLSTGGVSGSQDVGAFVGWSDNATYANNYFVNDKGVVNAIGTNNSGGGVNPAGTTGASQAELKCPVTPDDTACAASTLYSNWGTTNWDFGTDVQFPGLIIDSVVYRDGDGDGVLD